MMRVTLVDSSSPRVQFCLYIELKKITRIHHLTMKALSNLLLVFNAQQQSVNRPPVSTSLFEKIPFLSSNPLAQNNNKKTQQRNVLVQELLDKAKEVGPVGSLVKKEDREMLEILASKVVPFSDPNPAKFPLTGEHQLVYSAAPGASSGRIFGNVVGKVSQFFETDEIFYNRVAFGPLMIALQAKREIKNGSNIKVSFLETSFSLLGNVFSQKQAGGGGVWKVRFVGKVQDEDGTEKLVRIMETPSLFILEQPLN
jgi:hypothetical protein